MNRPFLVLKCGGSTMEQLPDSFFAAIADLQQSGQPLAIVHGGGPAINALLSLLQIPARFVDGLRVTCEQTMQVVEMVLGGSINKQLVRRIHQAGGRAWGVSGVDGALLTARRTEKPLGLVGEIEQVDTAVIRAILQGGYVPVIAPLAVSRDGGICYNVNADIAAGAIAAALQAEKLLMITDVPGILGTDEDGGKTLLRETSPDQIKAMIAAGDIYGGMIPKVKAALDALKQGVKEVVICQGTAETLRDACAGKQTGTSVKGVVVA
ncbi:acetylglutamate kinase [Brevibacillus sp. SYP-B805]|uniref:acetylglutamate kinase n=1 Tax=Brevibacillus sp. SYP-B805 TaxID=1578199 RepID=UPI0013EBBB7E|nr:acetylglutamate kinase [Brevibacillus sp. SYP-B805]NGQ95670.1 acetylglutamate kinase [Brevibacillus sp. SYP-B805]